MFKELAAILGIAAVTALGKAQLTALLLKLKTDEGDYANMLQGMYSGFTILSRLAKDSKSTIDDQLINMLVETVEEVAALKGVTLTKA